ncbi:MAG: putative phosphate transporter, phosphate-binding protein [Betaproteobacteria bacterium]|nr:putative phosphate transporter, phosphate-binding protein [Betaproteobacteria bacterium]
MLRIKHASETPMISKYWYCSRAQQVAIALLSLVLASPSDAQQSATVVGTRNKLTITGSLTLYPLVTDLARRFEQSHPGAKIDVQPGGSTKAQADVRSGAADIGMMPRALRSSDQDLFAFPIARDGIAVLINTDNAVRGINTVQLAGVITGRISNWKALGDRDAAISLALREEREGSTDMILEHLKLQRSQITRHKPITTSADAIKFVANTPNGISLASIGEAERSARNGVPIKLLAYNGVPAATRTIQNHLYGLSRPMTLITRRLPEGLQKDFIEYATSTQVTDLQLKYGFVPYE